MSGMSAGHHTNTSKVAFRSYTSSAFWASSILEFLCTVLSVPSTKCTISKSPIGFGLLVSISSLKSSISQLSTSGRRLSLFLLFTLFCCFQAYYITLSSSSLVCLHLSYSKRRRELHSQVSCGNDCSNLTKEGCPRKTLYAEGA